MDLRPPAAPEFDPISQDPPGADALHPAALMELAFESGGSRLNGVALIAEGPGPHPSLLMLHGFPGYERNLDLAHAFRRAGWNALVFHYRGAWGSQGEFTFGHVIEDVENALAFLGSAQARDELRVDDGRLALVGHSMGGWAALVSVAGREDLLGACCIAGYNFAGKARQIADDPAAIAAELAWYGSMSRPLNIRSERHLFDELLMHDEWDLLARGAALARRELLMIGATRDTEAPMEFHHRPVAEAVEAGDGERLREMVFETDHAFSDKRVALARAVSSWLSSLLA